ncbi:hypothetical protein [Pseudomonas protegens]|uniref:hypothetical protein n=1 Tax=Pseudomonas protegens TaxID=380021 RepID=UPI001F28582E|nr:hypothetical protein [Pseudomonas protegens]
MIQHLKDYPQKEHLLAWERAGALLALNGRGDDWPQDLAALIPPEEIEVFSCIVDSAVEVGIVDLFGDSTDLPVILVRKITALLGGQPCDLPESQGPRAL